MKTIFNKLKEAIRITDTGEIQLNTESINEDEIIDVIRDNIIIEIIK